MSFKSEVSGLLHIAGEKKGLLTVASVFSFFSSLLQLVPFVAVYKIVEELLNHAQSPEGADKELILYWGGVAFIACIGALVALYIGGMCSHIAAFNILYQLRVRLAEHVAKVPMGYHTNTTTGELKKIIEVSVEKIEKFIAHQLPDIVSAVMIPILLMGYLFWLDWRLALVLLIPIGFGFWLQTRMFTSVRGQTAYRGFQYAVEEMNATGVEYVRAMPAVKIFGVTAESFLTFKQSVAKYRDISLKITDLCKTPYSLFFVVVSSLFTFIVPVGILLGNGHSGSQSFAITFILFLIIAPSLSVPLLKLMHAGSGMREIVEGNKRIEAIFSEAMVTEPVSPQVPTAHDIAFKQVSFAYETKESKDFKPVLNGIHFVARAGEMTALVGPSGGGKSTIANLLLRFWDVQEGDITIGGVPIREMGTEKLMDTVSFVFQDVHLFYDTIEANIRMGNTTASNEEVIAAAKTACCHEFIEKLAYGYDTKIGEGGTYLSGGEAQRIAIARALLKNAPILVLDEATAYADAGNEKKIQRGLAELVKGKTVLIIAHRLSTIRAADQILVVKRGEIAERGTHDELRKLNGLYEQMWQAHISAASWRLGAKDNSPAHAVAAKEGSG
ncbi:ABC transporter ATP-binding protein [Paenibacillus chitinolyticus]|uniref:ABC transporter ATP-binding protein n=1 Tax=Paenibacillus chitinolyticus TaxID=79263 RepID=A0A410WW77_9BACL|nr:ABC transporter ATP-binding protein [Paenibacillus chitinolyticus]MCY9589158.1 ABC transporter ATP-binding protein/permease [Paenibacillus chitinolyticus]MCY9594231.1 ABC transporter ATP-binding protein/permease [Paenibacillus chitinolyticus]QAV18507.1 ABC transporter ATP-binding protein [Paenibacillus chitinolyticus]